MNMKKSLLALSTAAAVALSGTAVAGAQDGMGMPPASSAAPSAPAAPQAGSGMMDSQASGSSAPAAQSPTFKEGFNSFFGLRENAGLVEQIGAVSAVMTAVVTLVGGLAGIVKVITDAINNFRR